jgi:hypothetical protein
MYSSNTSLISNEEKIRILELHYKTKVIESKKKNYSMISEQTPPSNTPKQSNVNPNVTNNNSQNTPKINVPTTPTLPLPPITNQKEYLKWIQINCFSKTGIEWVIQNDDITPDFYLSGKGKTDRIYIVRPNKKREYSIYQDEDGQRTFVTTKIFGCPALDKAEDDANPLTQGRNVTISSGAKTLEQLRAMNLTDEDIKQRWQKHPTYANLYIRKDVLKTSAFTDDQQSFINKWKNVPENRRQIDKGVFKLGTEITGNDFAGGWDKNNFFIAEDSEEFFPNGLKVYINTENLEQPNKEMCKTQIKQFADMFKRSRSRKYDSGQVKLMQMYIQDCVNTFNFGGPLSGVKDDLNVLAGRSSNGALRRQDKDWFIQLPSNF